MQGENLDRTVFDIIKNKGISAGAIAVSTAGHDKNIVYLIVFCENRLARAVNGFNRGFSNPKTKRVSHLKQIGRISDADAVIDRLKSIKSNTEQNTAIKKNINEAIITKQKEQGKEVNASIYTKGSVISFLTKEMKCTSTITNKEE